MARKSISLSTSTIEGLTTTHRTQYLGIDFAPVVPVSAPRVDHLCIFSITLGDQLRLIHIDVDLIPPINEALAGYCSSPRSLPCEVRLRDESWC
jgi:hypothetical protein